MSSHHRFFSLLSAGVALAAAPLLGAEPANAAAACADDNAEITLPAAFCATIFADNLGHARHIAVGPDGTLYVNTRPDKKNASSGSDGFLIALRDEDGDGKAESEKRFGPPTGGGTGLAAHQNYLYAESHGRIIRFELTGGPNPPSKPEDILDGLVTEKGHTMHSIAIGDDNTLYVNSGSATNACQVADRQAGSPGEDPCKELATRAGIWKYSANTSGQHFSAKERLVTGVRNTVALAIHPTAGLILVAHGRDQLHENWPERFTAEKGSNLPAEVMLDVEAGQDYGWPYCYYDGAQSKYVLAPEYGGDGKDTKRCESVPAPIAVYPAHWAPNGMVFYTATAFPEKYRGGAFIAFHGSWNRDQQEGYDVVFQPMDLLGKPSGQYEIFADGFAGPNKTPEGAAHRPVGLAVGDDGALFVSDDQGGRIYRIVPR